MKLFLCGDVMTGRGIDQILAHPAHPGIHEQYARSALDYVRLAEAVNGPISRAVEPAYIWGDALRVLEQAQPEARIVNLETAVTRSQTWAPKGINYRMDPANISCLTSARLDCCVLANNHVLDWGEQGLIETIGTLHAAGLRTAGAGRDQTEAETPAILPAGAATRLRVYALGVQSSGIPAYWAATAERPGVAFLPDLNVRRAEDFASRVTAMKRPGDVVVASVHWGGNWGYRVHQDEREFAHALIDRAGVDLLHGHSSHHPKGIEVYRRKLILWGCGDFINDYEGIRGHEEYRPDLSLMYFPTLDDVTGELASLELVATQMKRFQVRLATTHDARWLCSVLSRESTRFGTSAAVKADGSIALRW